MYTALSDIMDIKMKKLKKFLENVYYGKMIHESKKKQNLLAPKCLLIQFSTNFLKVLHRQISEESPGIPLFLRPLPYFVVMLNIRRKGEEKKISVA